MATIMREPEQISMMLRDDIDVSDSVLPDDRYYADVDEFNGDIFVLLQAELTHWDDFQKVENVLNTMQEELRFLKLQKWAKEIF